MDLELHLAFTPLQQDLFKFVLMNRNYMKLPSSAENKPTLTTWGSESLVHTRSILRKWIWTVYICVRSSSSCSRLCFLSMIYWNGCQWYFELRLLVLFDVWGKTIYMCLSQVYELLWASRHKYCPTQRTAVISLALWKGAYRILAVPHIYSILR